MELGAEEEAGAGAEVEVVVEEGVVILTVASFLVTLLLIALVVGSGVVTSPSGMARTGLCTSETRY